MPCNVLLKVSKAWKNASSVRPHPHSQQPRSFVHQFAQRCLIEQSYPEALNAKVASSFQCKGLESYRFHETSQLQLNTHEVAYVASRNMGPTWQQPRNKKLCRSQICRGFLALHFLRFARSTSPLYEWVPLWERSQSASIELTKQRLSRLWGRQD